MNSKPTARRRALALLLALLLLGSLSGTALAEETSVNVTGQYFQSDARTMLEELNAFRTSDEAWYWSEDNTTKIWCPGLKELTYDYTLERIAMLRAAEITLKWDHERPDGTSCFTAYEGTNYMSMGENLAMGTFLDRVNALTCLEETDEFYSGQGHRRTMLNSSFTAVGIAHFQYDERDFWVQEFGSPTLDTTVTTPNDSETTVTVSLVPSSTITDVPAKQTVSLTLRWPRDKKATGYQLQCATDRKFKKNKKTVTIKKNKTTKYTFKNQKPRRTYYMRIRSYKKSGTKTKYSKWSNTVSFVT